MRGWQARTLSMAERTTLANSVLLSIPLYVMQSTKVPRGICDKIDSQVCDFVWGSTLRHRSMHLLSKEKIARPRKFGGLGIRSMRHANSAILAKLGWRILQEPNALWARVIRGKYCNNRADVDMFQDSARSSQMWKGILLGAETLSKGLKMVVGNGRSTLFWFHVWLIDKPLIDVVILDVPEDLVGATVAELWSDNGWDWVTLSQSLPALFH